MIPKLLAFKIAQLFVIMIFGFLMAKLNVIKKDDSCVLSKLSLYLLMPAIIISSFNIEITPAIYEGITLAFGAALVLHFVFLIIDMIYKKVLKPSATERASVMYSNAGNLIVPIVGFILGNEWIIYSSAYIAVQQVFVWTHCVCMYSGEKKVNIKKILLNPNIIAIVCGLVVLISGFKIPEFAGGIIDSLGSMIGTVGMLICGIMAAFVDYGKILSDKRLYIVCALRMLISPAIALVILWLFNISVNVNNAHSILLVSFLASMTPSAATITQFAQIYNKESDLAVGINIISTIFCIITMPLFVAIYQSII